METQTNKIKQGDIILLGDHILGCGSATDKEFIKKVIGENKIKSIISDPPYGVKYVENKNNQTNSESVHKKIQNDDIENEDQYVDFTKAWVEEALQHLTSYNQIYIFHADLMTCAIRKAIKELGCYHSQNLVWVKNSPVLGRKDYLPMHELISYGWYGRHKFNKRKDYSVIFHPKPNKSSLHPTMKPVGLMRKVIMNATEIGDVVYDPFLGSGSTLIACEHLKRKCIGIELDADYVKVIADRWSKLTGKQWSISG